MVFIFLCLPLSTYQQRKTFLIISSFSFPFLFFPSPFLFIFLVKSYPNIVRRIATSTKWVCFQELDEKKRIIWRVERNILIKYFEGKESKGKDEKRKGVEGRLMYLFSNLPNVGRIFYVNNVKEFF